MGNDWTFEAKDARSGATHTIDRRWQQWGPAIDPLHNEGGEWKGRFERAEDCDERLFLDPDGPYVLAWRIDESTSYYASDYRYYCDYMTDAEAAAWFAKQNISPHNRQAATTEHRALWELGRRIAPALDALCSAIGELFDGCGIVFDEGEGLFCGINGAAGRKVRAAVVALHALMPPENDPFREWELVGAPRGTQDFVDIVSGIDAFTKGIVADVAFDRANSDAYWKRALKLALTRYDVLLKGIVQLESLHELHQHVLTEALRKLQAPAPATDGAAIGVQAVSPAVVQSIERRIEPDGTVSGTPPALRTFDALDAGAVKATSAAAVEAPVAQGVAVEPAPSAVATESKAPKRKRQRRKLLSEKGLTPIQIETYQIWAECKGNVSETARRLGKDRKTVQETLDAAKTKLGKNATKHIAMGFRHDRRGQADVDADGDRRLA